MKFSGHRLMFTSVQIRLTLASMAFFAGAALMWYPSGLQTSPVFFYVNSLGIPWWVFGALLALGGIFITVPRIRPVGYLVGAVVYSFFSVCTSLACIGGLHWAVFTWMSYPRKLQPNPFAVVNLLTIAMIYWIVLRDSIYKQVDPELEKILRGSVRDE